VLFRVYVVFCFMFLVVSSTCAIDCLERFVSEMTCCVLNGTLNFVHLPIISHMYSWIRLFGGLMSDVIEGLLSPVP